MVKNSPRGSMWIRKGVIHLASVPLVMGFQKLRHLMEQFGEVGRVYLAPEVGMVGGMAGMAKGCRDMGEFSDVYPVEGAMSKERLKMRSGMFGVSIYSP